MTLNDAAMGEGTVTPKTVAEVTTLRAGIEELLLDQTNAVVIGRTAAGDQTGKGQLYYTTRQDLPAGGGRRAA